MDSVTSLSRALKDFTLSFTSLKDSCKLVEVLTETFALGILLDCTLLAYMEVKLTLPSIGSVM